MINASPHINGNTAAALNEMKKVFEAQGIEVDSMDIGKENIRGCVACGSCGSTGKCAFDDAVNIAAQKLEEADGMVIGSPVYFANANASLTALMTRLFYSSHFDKRMKVGASVVAARRGGTTAAYDSLNKFYTISGMPVAASSYWNNVHGGAPGEAVKDEEGMQIMRNLANNMIFLMKSISLGKEAFGLPEAEASVHTNYIR